MVVLDLQRLEGRLLLSFARFHSLESKALASYHTQRATSLRVLIASIMTKMHDAHTFQLREHECLSVLVNSLSASCSLITVRQSQ